ncbi:hypothetical protein FQN53_002607 [Emmonsiellopsis sp. PD_33]|nr:hypothetical protein FQN53_002607 [Emmonsiellopsis sp. PD_33]
MDPRIARKCLPYNRYRSFSVTARRRQVQLAHQVFGPRNDATASTTKRNPIIFMHGVFGSKQNNRSISKALASQLNTNIYTIDLRNHGDSPHRPEHTYTAMANDVEQFIHQFELEKPILIGHSMGAKTAMTVALRSPDLISSLIAVDNAPVSATLGSQFQKYVKGMHQIEAAKVTKQSDADRILQEYEESLPIRQFLLTNLIRSKEDNTFKFRINLKTLGESLDRMADFPFKPSDDVKFDGPSLFVRGTRSHYIQDKSLPIISHFFPKYQLKDVDAGHWLISENPNAFNQAVTEFLQ